MGIMLKKISLVFLGMFFVWVAFQPEPVRAASCTASVTPIDGQPSVSSVEYSFTITAGDTTALWVKISTPFTGITISGIQLSGWTKINSGDNVIFTGTLPAGSTMSPKLFVDIGDIGGSNGNWSIQASADLSGSSPYDCTGALGLAISGSAGDVTAPTISGVSVSSITSSSAVITWTTDEVSNSKVEYDVNANFNAYPFSHTDSNLVTNHSLTATNSIAAGTTYYYRVCSTDASGNQGCSGEGSFTTVSATAATAAPTTTAAVVTVTPTLTPTPTPIPVDSTPPRVSLTTVLESSYEEAPLIEGSATDNEIITRLDYSTDGGVNWLPVDDSEGIGSGKATFSFTPYIFEDGSYEISVRAIDDNENTGTSDTLSLVLDRLPPRVGGNFISIGPQPLIPNEDGVIITMKNLEQKITMSAVGGATQVSLFVEGKQFDLTRSDETTLWSGNISIDKSGLYKLKTKAEDGAGNITERDINPILVVEPGKVYAGESKPVTKGSVTLYIKDTLTNTWAVWDGKTFGQENPQQISEFGEYQYFLPGGDYYLEISSPGYAKLTSKIFKINETTAFNADFHLEKASTLNFLFFKIPFPSFLSEKSDVKLKTPEFSYQHDNSLIETSAPSFSLPTTSGETFDIANTKGKAFVLSFISTWSPLSIEQIPLINQAQLTGGDAFAELVAVQETVSKLSVFIKKGKYDLDTIVDADGDLVDKYQIKSLPTHFFIDRKGVIKKVITGVLTKDEFESLILESI
jgi:peroxiredoxin